MIHWAILQLPPQDSSAFIFIFVSLLCWDFGFSLQLGFDWGGAAAWSCKGRGVEQISGIRMHEVKSTKNQLKLKNKEN